LQRGTLQNILITAINPLLKYVTNKFDIDCEKDASLLINSLRRFLGENVHLCESCAVLDYRVANPFYQIATRFMHFNYVPTRRAKVQLNSI
jgi:hypothetical protein